MCCYIVRSTHVVLLGDIALLTAALALLAADVAAADAGVADAAVALCSR